jgi:[ribosomal protein S5]-alanine N-acetyltransferase
MAESLKGDRVTLRPPKPSDKADRLALGRSPEIVRLFGGNYPDLPPLAMAEIDGWYDDIESDPHSWMIEYEGRCIGSARLHSFSEDGAAFYAVGILDPRLLGHRLGREITALVLAFAFRTLRLKRIDLRVLTYNKRAIRSYIASGFRETAIERNAVQIDGEWHDDLIMSIHGEDWRRLRY